jgi:hypothetical protein
LTQDRTNRSKKAKANFRQIDSVQANPVATRAEHNPVSRGLLDVSNRALMVPCSSLHGIALTIYLALGLGLPPDVLHAKSAICSPAS